MNFTWYASAYDTDDVPYRLKVLLQIVGVLVIAAGVPRAFARDFSIVFADRRGARGRDGYPRGQDRATGVAGGRRDPGRDLRRGAVAPRRAAGARRVRPRDRWDLGAIALPVPVLVVGLVLVALIIALRIAPKHDT